MSLSNEQDHAADIVDVLDDGMRVGALGQEETSCPHPIGSYEADVWLMGFWDTKAAPYFRAGEVAGKQGVSVESCPSDIPPCLQESWKNGWKIAAEGPFPGLKDIVFEHRYKKAK